MKIGMKLTLGFAITIILLIVIAVLGITNLSSLNTEVDELVHDKFIKTVWANGVIDEINAMARALRNAIITDDPEFSKKELQRITDGQAVIASNLDSLERTIVSEEGKKILEEIQTARKVFIDERNVIIDLVKANGVNGVDNNKQIQELLFKSFRKTQSNYMGSVTKLIEFQTELFNKAGQDAEATYNSAFMIILILAIVAIILAVGIALWVTKQITKPINQAVTASDSIAKGNLKVNLESNSKDETGLLLAAMRTMSANLNDMVKELNEVSSSAADGKLDKRANEAKFEGEYRNIMSGFNKTLDAVIGPLNVTAEYVDRISKGDIPPKITDEYKGDFNEIKNNLNQCIDAVNALVSDAALLSKAAKEGKLDTRANANRHFGDFREIVQGVNDTLDNVIGPLNVAAEYVDRISKGDIPPKITDNYNGDFNEIKNNLNGCIDAINALVKDAKMLATAAVEGKLDTRADASKHGGDFKAIVDGVNATLDNVIGPLNVAAEYVDRISKGDIPPKITDNYNGDFNEIKNNLNGCIDAVNALVSDALMLANAAKEGKLDTRANADKHYGDFREIVKGVNNTLDSVIGPLNVAAEYVDRISKGDIPPKITDNYNGDFNEIKNNLNGCIDSLNGLINDMNFMSKQHDLGEIDVQMDGSKFTGAYKDMALGVNEMVFGHIAVKKKAMACFMEFGNGNLDAVIEVFPGKKVFINNTIEKVRENIKALVTDAAMLAKAAEEGKLDTRADASRHQGDFRKIVDGVNKTLDNVIGPLNVAAEYVDRISKGDIPPKITDNYNGDFNEIKNNLNQAIDAIDALVSDSKKLAKAAEEGQLATRADSSRHQGDFKEIVDGVNKTLDNVIAPINEAAEILGQMATGDLTVRMFGDYKGDLSKLKDDVNALGDSLSQLIIQVNESVQNTASAALEISSTAEGLAASSQEQSAQADEVASAVEEMSRTVTENAMSATRTAEVAQQNGEVASEGAKIVKQTVTKMRDIADVVKHSAQNIQKLGESSKQIGEIISVIDDIADQTNLLALNAAIEAARAGEQGRGFAVVADEVRKLAERTTEATKQIANMIKGIQSETEMAVIAMNQGTIEVQSGIEYADRAGESLNAILSSTQELLDMINQIAAASEQQSATSEQISKNVMSISKVTSESAQRVEDVAHTSEDLAKLTEHLRNLMANFQVDDAGAGFSSRGLAGKPKRQLHGR